MVTWSQQDAYAPGPILAKDIRTKHIATYTTLIFTYVTMGIVVVCSIEN